MAISETIVMFKLERTDETVDCGDLLAERQQSVSAWYKYTKTCKKLPEPQECLCAVCV